jgi:hypothetical protein
MEQKESKRTLHKVNKPLLFFLDMFLYFLHFSYREGDGGMVGDHARSCRLRSGDNASFIAPRCNNRGGRAAGHHRSSKKAQ